MPHNFGKLSIRARTLLYTSPQLEVYTQSYGPPKLRKSQFWEFRDSHLGVPGQNDIWVLVLWPSTKYTIMGKAVASPKFRPWWVLRFRAPKVFQLHINQLIWFVQVRVSNWFACPSSSSPSRSSNMPFYPQNATSQGVRPNSLSFYYRHLCICSWIHQGAWGCIM
jgi:hypothetical protein